MLNPQTQKSECNCSFHHAPSIFIKNNKNDAAIYSSLIPEDEQINARADHGTSRDSLNPSCPGMAITANGSLPFYEELKFFAKLRLISVAASITVITTIMGIMVTG